MTDKNFQLVSILNFDPKTQKDEIINSPRSVEACKRQGIDPKDLLVRSVIELKELHKNKNYDKDGWDLFAQRYEEKRKDKIRVVIEERNALIEDEKNGYLNFSKDKKQQDAPLTHMTKSTVHALLNTKTDSTLIEKEKKQLERIKQKQEKEIKQIIEYEQKMSEIQEKQEEKVLQQKEKERFKELELAKKRKEAEEIKRQKELEKEKRAEELEQQKQQMLEETKRKDEEQKRREYEKEMQRQAETRKREEEQKKKQEEFKQKSEALILETNIGILKKKEEMEMKEQQRREYLQDQATRKAKDAEERRKQGEERLKQAKEKNDELIARKREEFNEKQSKLEEKKRQFELEREKRAEENKKQAEKQAETIKKVLEDNAKMMEAKKEQYREKEAHAEQKKRENDLIMEAKLQQLKEQERQKEESRKQVKDNMETRLKNKIDNYLQLMESNDIRVAQTQATREAELKKKYNIESINRNDRLEFAQRKARMDEYRREKIMEKIQKDHERGEKIKQDRAALIEMRSVIKKEMQSNKQSLLEQFERAKKGKLNESTQPDQMRSQYSSNPSNSAIQRIPIERARSPVEKTTTAAPLKTDRIEKAPAINNERKNNATAIPVEISEKKAEKPQQPRSQVESPAKLLTEKEARKELEDLKMKQNQDMLRLLEEEHAKENQREAKLRAITDPQEFKRYEKIYASERTKSHAKIQALSGTHDESIRQFMSKNGVKTLG